MSNQLGQTSIGDLSPEAVRLERDRRIAKAYVEKGESRSAVGDIVRETSLNQRTVYRAIKRQLSWARRTLGRTSEEATS